MKDFNKSHNIAGQSNIKVQKSHKHDANLQKNSSLYFQIGLILCLLGTYALFEMEFENKVFQKEIVYVDPDDRPYFTPTVVIVPNEPTKLDPIERSKEKRLIDDPIIVDDNTPDDVETPNIITDPPVTDKPLNPTKVIDPVDPGDDDIDKPFNMVGVEVVPVYPGCEKMTSNGERIKCMNEKITKLVQRKFDTDLAGELGLSGTQRINVQFKIDKNGNITEILTRAPHPSLEKEAERVTNKIPQMKPGLQREQPVSVLYNLPIVFKVN